MSNLRRGLLPLVAAGALAASREASVSAGANSWTELGPPGATVDSLVANPHDRSEIFLLAGGSKVYRSRDGGASWTLTGPPFASSYYRLVACGEPLVLVAVSYFDYSRRSVDRGKTWATVPVVGAVTCDAAGTIYGWRGNQAPPLASSRDGGLTWAPLDPGIGQISSLGPDSLGASPLVAGLLYGLFTRLDGAAGKVYKSETFGESWARADSGLPVDDASGQATYISVSASPAGVPNTAMVASVTRGSFETTDGGASWTKRTGLSIRNLVPGSVPGRLFAIPYDPLDSVNSSTSGILNRSADGGMTWRPVDTLTERAVRGAATADGTNLVVGTGRGAFLSSDDGNSWRLTTDELAAVKVDSLAVSPARPGTLYAAATTGLLRSDDRGAHWSRIQADLPTIYRVAVAPDNADQVWAAGESSLWRSDNARATWARLSIGLTFNARPIALQVAAGNSRRILLAYSTEVYYSADGGASWTGGRFSGTGFSAGLRQIRMDDSGLSVLAVSDGNPVKVWRSSDGGGFYGLSLPGSFPNATLAQPTFSPDGSIALLSADYGLVNRSTDGGQTWSQLPFGQGDRVYRFAWAADDETVFAVSSYATSASRDRGLTWTVVTEPSGTVPYLLSSPVADLAVDPADSSVLYAATPLGVIHYQQATPAGPCVADSRTLCLVDKRFKVQVAWHNQYSGASGQGGAVPRTDLTGFFYFSDPANIELILKVLPFGDTVKVFYGQLTDLAFTMTVTDTRSGQVKTYRNSAGNCGAIDQAGFPGAQGDVIAWKALAPENAAMTSCTANANTLCLLGGRFAVTVDWRNQFNGDTGRGSQVTLSSLSGQFYYTSPDNVELLTKVLDFGDRFLFLYGALSDLEYTIGVTDTVSGSTKTYFNPAGRYCGGLDNDLLAGGTTAPVGEISLDAAMPAARRARRILEIRRQLSDGGAVRVALRGDADTSASELTDALVSQLADIATVAERRPRGRFGLAVLLELRR